MILELAIAGWAGFAVWRRVLVFAGDPSGKKKARPGILPITAAVLLITLVIATGAMQTFWEANPQGSWDAWAIWNLRARFLTADGLAQRAWSPTLGANTHAEYPLLLSGFIARCWTYSHSFSPATPIATGYAFFLAMIALLAGGVALLRGPLLGLLTALAVAATPTLLHEVPGQYADVPLACYYAGALMFALLDRPVLAAVFAGLAAWTKDEGLLFLLALFIALALWRRRNLIRATAAALPAVALLMFFKLVLAKGNSSIVAASAQGAIHRLAEMGRYTQVAAAFRDGFLGMAASGYHPVFPLIALAIALRFDRQHRRNALFCGTVMAVVLLGYFGIYLITAVDLAWLLQTSLYRLLVQVWPSLVLAVMIALRTPRMVATETPAVAKKAHSRRR